VQTLTDVVSQWIIMASYSFDTGTPPAGATGESRDPRLNATLPLPAVPSWPFFVDEAAEGRRSFQPVLGGSHPRGYRTLAEAANALAEAAAAASAGQQSASASTVAESRGPDGSESNSGSIRRDQSGLADPGPSSSGAPPPPMRPRVPNIRVAMVPQAVPVLVSDDVVSGTKRDGWMSPVRRFFCLLVTFDVLFTALLWLITVIVTGQDVMTALKHQVLEYTIHSSMFDLVVSEKKTMNFANHNNFK
jgi:hypothetical protein